MSKEIIIDGVNVAGCKHFWNIKDAENLELCKINFDNNYFSNGLPLAEKCKEHNNCYYKQLKRLQAENEELKAGLCKQCDFQKQYFSETKKLLVENKELKHKNEILLGQLVINDGEDVTVQISQSQFNEYNELRADNERLKEEITTLECKLDAEKPSMIIPKPKQLAVPIEEVETYQKALEEIREILKGNKDGDIDEMIDKISEVLNG